MLPTLNKDFIIIINTIIIIYIIIIIIIVIIIVIIIIIIITTVNKNQVYSTYPMFIFFKEAFGGHCFHFQVYNINCIT